MSGNIFKTRTELQRLAETHSGIIVSYSTGKDSQILLDLASKVFSRVVALHMYFVPGLAYIEEGLDYARRRWGCEVMQLPHWGYVEAVKTNQYCNLPGASRLADIDLSDIYKVAMARTGLRLVATGARKSDGLWRRRWMKNIRRGDKYDDVIFPLSDWLKLDITSYVKANRIEIPELSRTGRQDATGIGLNNETILWLYDRHRGDYELVRRVFPFIEAVPLRRQFYGIGGNYGRDVIGD